MNAKKTYGSRIGRMFLSMLLLWSLLWMTGCREETPSNILGEGEYYTYYVNSSGTALVSRVYEPKAAEQEAVISELLLQCQTTPTIGDGRRAIPANVVMLKEPSLSGSTLCLYFDTTYTTMDKVTELLCKAALAKTFTQVEGVDNICIFVNGEPYKGSNTFNTEKTLWNSSDFLDNTGDDTNKYIQTELTLYFANADGKTLAKEVRQVIYSNTLALERVVLNQLIQGPQSEGLVAALPKNLKVQGISLRDGVCYVDFDASFLEEPVSVLDQVEVYSVVNSLTELSNVMQVQITVNGSSDVTLRNNVPLNSRFEKNLSLIAREPVPPQTMPD